MADRAAFEAWVKKEHGNYQIDRFDDDLLERGGEYEDWPVQVAWEAWQAANQEMVNFVSERWNAEVKGRPVENVHRRTLDETWKQMLRHLGSKIPLPCAYCSRPEFKGWSNGKCSYCGSEK